MTDAERAKQFSPYAALKGFGETVLAMERESAERVLLGEDAQEELNRRLQALRIGDIISVSYYLDRQYVEAFGRLRKIIPEEGLIQVGPIRIPLRDIRSLRGGEET